jgi:hypothetical protein
MAMFLEWSRAIWMTGLITLLLWSLTDQSAGVVSGLGAFTIVALIDVLTSGGEEEV